MPPRSSQMFFVLNLYVTINIFSVMSGRVFLGCTSTKQRIQFLAQGYNAMPPVRLDHPRFAQVFIPAYNVREGEGQNIDIQLIISYSSWT